MTTTQTPGTPAARGLSRRQLLRHGAVSALLIITPTAIISPDHAWGLEPGALSPEEMATLVTMARDIYPHDQVPDRFYAIAMKGHDTEAAADPEVKVLLQSGIADLNNRADGSYRSLGWEDQRVAILREIETTPFFQTIRGGMVTGLYNQPDIWPIFGYEGESFSKGGYINRGFNDIEWL